MIEIHLFEQLVTFASCGTLSAAAEQLQEFDRKRRTIFVAFCTPVLISDFVSLLSQVYEGMAISTEVSTDPEQTEAALREGKYHLAILYRKPDEAEFYSVPIESEHLYVSLPPVPSSRRCRGPLPERSGRTDLSSLFPDWFLGSTLPFLPLPPTIS